MPQFLRCLPYTMRGKALARTTTAIPKPLTVDLPSFCFRAAIGTVDVETRTVELVFSTGAPVTRMDWWTGKRYIEKLSLKPEHVRIERLNTIGPLLDTHSAYSLSDQIGTVVPGSVTVNGKEGRCRVRFSKRDAVEPVFQDVVDGIYKTASVGYDIYKFEEDAGNANKLPTRLATDWEPYEISMVPMPADAGAQVRAGDKSHTKPCVIVPRTDDADRLRRFRLAMAR